MTIITIYLILIHIIPLIIFIKEYYKEKQFYLENKAFEDAKALAISTYFKLDDLEYLSDEYILKFISSISFYIENNPDYLNSNKTYSQQHTTTYKILDYFKKYEIHDKYINPKNFKVKELVEKEYEDVFKEINRNKFEQQKIDDLLKELRGKK
jgi:hypothetical protein